MGELFQNYDDQSVDSVPYGTRDLEYTTARKGVPFYPVSENPVVEVEPVQETFTGAHTAEVGNNVAAQMRSGYTVFDYFRMSSSVLKRLQKANRLPVTGSSAVWLSTKQDDSTRLTALLLLTGL